MQPAGDVVLAAAFPNLESATGVNAALTRIEPEHDFAQTHQIPAAIIFRLDRETHLLKTRAQV